jgi:hypothetical protein
VDGRAEPGLGRAGHRDAGLGVSLGLLAGTLSGVSDAGPHPNKAHATRGRRAYRLEPDRAAAHVVR